MGLSIVVGGQYGSEGKGKASLFFAKKLNASCVIRTGGSNSGHVVFDNGRRYAFQILPVASVLGNTTCVLPAGSYIDLAILQREIGWTGIGKDRLKVHPNAVIIDGDLKNREHDAGIDSSIGSTLSGTGAGVVARASRSMSVRLAKDEPSLKEYIADTVEHVRNLLDWHHEVLIEGTQGFGLSVFQTPEYPFATARDTTASGFLSEAGMSPLDVTGIVLVIRSFPIRVAGNSGPLPNETTWEEVTRFSGSTTPLTERTTVTDRIRRVAFFDESIVRKAIVSNQPTVIAMNHVDYFDYSIHDQERLSAKADEEVRKIEMKIGRTIDYVGTGGEILFERT